MAAIMVSRASGITYRHLVNFAACQSHQLTYCRRKHCYAIQSGSRIRNRLIFYDSSSSSLKCFSTVQTNTAESDDIRQKSQGGETDDSDTKKSKYNLKLIGAAMLCSTVISGCIFVLLEWGKPIRDLDGNLIEDEYTHCNPLYAYMMRTYREIFIQVKVTQEPSRDKLLPEPLTYPYIQPPYTLVLEMKDVLVHPEWTYKTGWRFKKRPGVDYFLKSVGPPVFEVVIYTKESGLTADPIITKIDPENFVMYRLYRDATRYQDGVHIKDLNCLNRDLSRVILIDWDSDAYKLNPDNGFKLKKWTGEMNDTALGELADFLKAIAASRVEDVRPVLKYYSEFDDPIAKFHENQRLLKEEQERQALKQQQMQNSNIRGIWSRFGR